MATFPKTRKIDFAEFQTPVDSRAAKYGLPTKVRFCKKCIISNQRPNSAVEFAHTTESKKQTIGFDDELICDPIRKGSGFTIFFKNPATPAVLVPDKADKSILVIELSRFVKKPPSFKILFSSKFLTIELPSLNTIPPTKGMAKLSLGSN